MVVKECTQNGIWDTTRTIPGRPEHGWEDNIKTDP
jgi:hypothetical protein